MLTFVEEVPKRTPALRDGHVHRSIIAALLLIHVLGVEREGAIFILVNLRREWGERR
jgi:hypothetical protein